MKKILAKDKMRRIFAMFFVMLASTLFIHSEVFAANGSGSASGEFGPHGCYGENASNLLQNVRTCNDGTGGASWHIFSIKNLPIEFSKTKIFEPEYRERPILNTENLPALKNFDSSKITKQCENADYYLAYVYDGWWGFKDSKNKIHNNVFSYWGPIPWKTQYMKNDKGVKHYPVYNNKQGALTADELFAEIKKGEDVNGLQIKGEGPTMTKKEDGSKHNFASAAADKIWKTWNPNKDGTTAVPKGTTWFCAEFKRTLKAYAVDEDTKEVLGDLSNTQTPKKAFYGDKVSVSNANFSKEGYTWHMWDINGKICRNNRTTTCTVNSLVNNTTVYAYYLRNQFKGRVYATITGSNDSIDTGYLSTNKKESKTIDCGDTGCKVNFGVGLQAVKGSGKTWYETNTTPTKSTPYYAPNTTGETVGQSSVTLLPGQTVCRKITFRPYGTLGNTDTRTVEACLTAKPATFQGIIKVSGASNGDTGWSDSSKQPIVLLANNCTNGCNVSFDHQMKKNSGIGSTNYKVSRTSNLTDQGAKPRSISNESNLANGSFSADVNKEVSVKNDNTTMYPGMKVCETLTFKPNTISNTQNASLTVCVYALGNAQPPDPPDTPEPPDDFTGNNAFVSIKVRNTNVSTYSNYSHEVYAKPGDKVDFRASYNPILQYTYYLVPDRIRINNEKTREGDGRTLGNLFNSYRGSLQPWNNGFSILDNSGTVLSNHNYPTGSFSRQSPNPNSREITSSSVGTTLKETARTSDNTTTQTTPSQVNFSAYNHMTSHLGTIYTASKSSEARVKIPYNFNNATEVTTPETDVAFAGETKTFNYSLNVNPRQNNQLKGNYSTMVKNAKWKIGIEYDADKNNLNDYQWSTVKEGSLNTNGDLNGHKKEESLSINIPDLNAGSEICIRSAIYPKDSHDDLNMDPSNSYDPNDPNAWSYSEIRCYKIAKRPSIQAWGGNVFSGGSINAARSIKNNLYGYTGYHIENLQGTFVFGSWGELGVISNGPVRGFASGATLGYASNNNGLLTPNPYVVNTSNYPPGGSNESSFCKHSLLTFANENCSTGTASGTGGKDATSGIKIDKDAIKALATNGPSEQTISSDTINLDELTNETIYTKDTDITITGGTLFRHSFKTIGVEEGNVTITGNIAISSDETFEKFSHTPKAVIYAKDTIFINCGVSRIDALLVANTVITCNNLAGDGTPNDKNIKDRINDEKNSNQLTVNGAIVASRLYANRTYGAAHGANSIVPAEIINFDPVLYLWGGVASSKSDEAGENNKTINGNIETTFIHELAPRH